MTDQKNITIGIDPSLNSTGICINIDDKEYIYYNITSNNTKKLREFSSEYINIIFYDKTPTDNKLRYDEREFNKTQNIFSICRAIEDIIKKHNPSRAVIEGVSFGSTGAICDLAGLNYAIRLVLTRLGVPFTVVPPTTWKKQLIGIAAADKDIIISTWKKLDTNIKDNINIKLDDLADSYFLSRYT